MNRRVARESVLKALYAEEIGHHPPAVVMDTILKADLSSEPDTFRFAEELYLKTRDNKQTAEERISQHSANWDLKRVAVIDRILLRMAVTEFLDFDDIPTKVTINEAIDMAKQYSTRDSGRFVNGLLDAILHDLKQSGTLNKKGRGLIESSAGGRSPGSERRAARASASSHSPGKRPTKAAEESNTTDVASATGTPDAAPPKPSLRPRKKRRSETLPDTPNSTESPL